MNYGTVTSICKLIFLALAETSREQSSHAAAKQCNFFSEKLQFLLPLKEISQLGFQRDLRKKIS